MMVGICPGPSPASMTIVGSASASTDARSQYLGTGGGKSGGTTSDVVSSGIVVGAAVVDVGAVVGEVEAPVAALVSVPNVDVAIVEGPAVVSGPVSSPGACLSAHAVRSSVTAHPRA